MDSSPWAGKSCPVSHSRLIVRAPTEVGGPSIPSPWSLGPFGPLYSAMQLASLFLAAAVFALGAVPASAQIQSEAKSLPKPARDADVESLDAILASLYDVISGPAGMKRDWDRMRSLFSEDARLGASGKRPDGTFVRRAMTVEEYIQRNAQPMEEGGFFEKEIGRRVDRYGSIVQVFSAYEARRAASDEKPFMRGINSLQLWHDGKRWWIVNLMWQPETPDNPIPEAYLKRPD
jgi:hypothetical protein